MPSQPIERAAAHALAGLQRHGDAVVILLEILDRAAGLQRDQVVVLAGAQEDAVDVVRDG